MKVIIACGGTGGHLFPGMAVAEALVARRHQVRLLVSDKAADHRALKALIAGCDRSSMGVDAVSAVGYGGPQQLIRFCYRLARATRDCTNVCREFRPDAVLGMGGFTSAPAVLAARWWRRRGTPTLIHESNAVPGKANRWVGRLVDHVAVGLADCARFFAGRPVTVTGTPIRAALRGGHVADAHERLGLRRGRLTVLVMGGSQGARAINEAVAAALPRMEDWREKVQFVHLTGARDEAFVRATYEENGFAANVMSFCNQMELAYSAADVALARSGAATLTELAAFGVPALLVPYPHATGDHQSHNAHVFEGAGAALVVEQTQRAGDRLATELTALLGDDSKRSRMAFASHSLAVANAEERIADLLERYGDTTTAH